jgi:parallel beta-helix repeat protein
VKSGQYLRSIGYLISGLILIGNILSANVVEATTFYVATNGNDSNPGTLSKPFRTMGKGVSVLTPGDTLYVRAGTYAEAFYNTIPGGTSWTNAVTVAAYPGETVTIRPGPGCGTVFHIFGSSKKYIIIDRFKIDGTNCGAGALAVEWATQDIASDYAHHIRMQNSEMFNFRGPSMNYIILLAAPHPSTGLTGYNELINLSFHDNDQGLPDTDPNAEILYIQSAFNLMERLHIYNNGGSAISVWNTKGESAHGNIIRNSNIHDNGLNPKQKGGGVTITRGDGTIAYNNLVCNNKGGTAVFNTGWGFFVAYGVRNAKLFNNTVYGNDLEGIYIDADADGTVVKNNIVYGNLRGPITDTGTNTVLSNNLTINPSFIDPVHDNFKIQPASAAIDEGVVLSEVPNDFDGVPRPQGSAYDVGAYEYRAGPVLPNPPANLRIVQQ